MGRSFVDVIDLWPSKTLIDWTEVQVSPVLRRDYSAHRKWGFREIRFFGQRCSGPYRNSGLAKKGLGATIVDDADINSDWLVGNDRCRIYSVNLRVDRSALALNESPSLYSADYRENAGKNSNYPSPTDHGPIKGAFWSTFRDAFRGVVTLGLIGFGAWLGVWSLGFWDWLGRWRWLISALGWTVMIGTIVQGLPVYPTKFLPRLPHPVPTPQGTPETTSPGTFPVSSLLVIEASVSP